MGTIKQLHNDSAVPLYAQVSNLLSAEIKNEKYLYGDKIPSEAMLCEMFNVSRITIRKAVNDLQEQGILIKKIGKGTYVAYPKIVEDVNAGGSFTKSCNLLNAIPSTEVISISKLKSDSLDSQSVKNIFSDYKDVIRVERVRMANGIPLIYEVDYFLGHHNFIMVADLVNHPLMETITSNSGLIANMVEEIFDVEFANNRISNLLKCNKSIPLLNVKQKVLTKDDELIYFNEQYIRQDLYKYAVRSTR